jgi:hypothetical protein
MSYHSELHAQIGFARYEWSADRFGAQPIRTWEVEETAPPIPPSCPLCDGCGETFCRDLAGALAWTRCPRCDGTGIAAGTESDAEPTDPTRDGIVDAIEAGLLDFGDLAEYDAWRREQGRLAPCPRCDGTGRDLAHEYADWLPCPDCGASGVVEP